MSVQVTGLARVLARSMLVLLLIATPVVICYGQTSAQDTEESTSPVDEGVSASVDDETTVPDAEVPSEPELDQTDVSVDPVDEADPATDTLPIEEEATPEPETEVPPPPTPTLNFDADSVPICLPVSSQSIAAGGDLDYTCTYTLALDGAHVDPATIMLDWSVAATVGGEWSVQLLDPTGDPSAWTDSGLAGANLAFQTAYSYDPSVGTLESLQDLATMQFGMRLHRPDCSTDPVSVELDTTGTASIPGSGDAIVTSNTAQPLVATFDPVLAPLDTSLPSVSIVDVSVDPIAFSLNDRQTHGALTIRVDNPVLQCQASNVSIAVQASAGSAIESGAFVSLVGSLDESSISEALPESSSEGSALNSFVIVSTMQDRAEVGSYLQTINFELTVPGAMVVGTYQLETFAFVTSAE